MYILVRHNGIMATKFDGQYAQLMLERLSPYIESVPKKPSSDAAAVYKMKDDRALDFPVMNLYLWKDNTTIAVYLP